MTNFVPTQAMIDNGGVVIRLSWRNYGGTAGNVVMTEWVPLVSAPNAALVLTPASISENGGVSTVTATLSSVSSAAVTITVSAAAGAGAVAADFSLSSATTLTIAANATTSTGTVTVTANDNSVASGSKQVTVSATATGGNGVAAPSSATLTITDDDAPQTTLLLSSSSIAENAGVATVTATLNRTSGAATTITVSAAAGAGAVAADFSLSSATTLTIAANATTSTGTVTITANDNDTDSPDKQVTVTATVANSQGAGSVTGATLTLTDDDAAPGVTLLLSSSSIAENAGVATVTATLDGTSSAATTITVSAAAVSPAVAADFSLSSATTLTIVANATTSTGTVTITANDNDTDSPDRTVTVTATVANDQGAGSVTGATLTLTDDDAAPGVTLAVSPASISENGGVATVSATLSHPSSAATTITVSAAPGTNAVAGDYTLSAATTVTIAANATTRTGTVTIAAVDNDVDAEDKTVTVSGTAANSQGAGTVTGASLTIRDDEMGLAFARAEDPDFDRSRVLEVTEGNPDGTGYTVALTSWPTGTVTVTVSGRGRVTASPTTLKFAAIADSANSVNRWDAAQAVTVTATDDGNDYADAEPSSVSHTASGGGYGGVSGSLQVSVTGETAVRTDGASGTRTYFIERREVEVTVGAGVPPGIELDFPATLLDSIALTIAPAPDNLPPSGAGFAVVDGTAVDISVADMASVPPGGVEVCLPATAAREVAGGQDLTLLHYAGSAWAPVTGSAWDATRMLVCAGGVTSFSPFALGYADRSIEFSDRSIEFAGSNQVYTVDEAIEPLVLPLVKEGTAVPPITYALTPAESLPPGLTFDAATRTLSGRPTEAFSATEYSWTARDADGSEKTLTFTIAVAPTLSIDSPIVTEGTGTRGGTLRFLVSLNAASGNQVTVGYADAGTGTATSGTDYTAIPAGTLTFAAGTTSQPIAVTVTGDATDEADETVVVRLSGPVNATLADASEGTGTIVDDDAALWVRLKAINESVLPELSRALWGSALDAVTGRLESPDAAAPTVADGLETAAGFARANESALEEGDVSWKELLGGESFAFGLAADGEGGPGAGGVVAWGSGDWRRLSRDENALDWSGDAFSAHLGADAALRPDLRGGLAASWFLSDVDYTDRSQGEAIAGSHESRMTSLTPYLGWAAGDGARLWGAAGYGWGEIEIVDADLRERFGAQKADSRFLAGAAGGSVPVWSRGPATLEAKGSAEATRWRVKDNGVAIAAVSAETQRLRLAAEGSRAHALPDGASLTPTLEAGVRWDGGDGATGAGLEAGGGLSWTDPARGLTVEAEGRALLVHNKDVEEWGASGSMRLAPDADGFGLSFRLLPSWGASGSGVARLWDEGVAAARPADGGNEARLETELGYGLPAFGGAGVTTPYAGFGLAQGGERDMRAGVRLGLGAGFDLGIEAERKEGRADTEHGVGLELRIRW